MKKINYWEQFMQSGRVEDYLQSCQNSGDTAWGKASGGMTEGESLHAGFGGSDGNGYQDDAGRGI